MSTPETSQTQGVASFEALPYILLNGLMFGSSLVASRFSLGQWQPLNFVGARITLAALACLSVYSVSSWRRLPRSRTFWLRVSVWGVGGAAIPMMLVVSSLQYQSSGLTSLLVASNPAMVGIIAHFVLPNERLTRRKIAGIALAFGGVIMLILAGESGLQDIAFDWRGPVFALLGITAAGASLVYARHFLRDYDAFDAATGRFVTALPVAWLAAILFEGLDFSTVRIEGSLALVYVGLVGTFGGMSLIAYNLKRFGATDTVQTAYIIPIFATLGGALFLGEQLTLVVLAGMVVILSGVWLVNSRSSQAISPASGN